MSFYLQTGGHGPKGDVKARRHDTVLWMKDASVSLFMIEIFETNSLVFIKTCWTLQSITFEPRLLTTIERLCMMVYLSFVFSPQVIFWKWLEIPPTLFSLSGYSVHKKLTFMYWFIIYTNYCFPIYSFVHLS